MFLSPSAQTLDIKFSKIAREQRGLEEKEQGV